MFKEIVLKGVKGVVKVSESGEEILYNDKLVNQYLLKTNKQTKGYLCCSLNGKQFYVHHIVALAYVHNSKPLTNKMVLHTDCNSLNNHYSNLSWGNPKELFKNRVRLNIPGAGMSGRDSTFRGGSAISHDEALKIALRLDKGETARAIAREYNVSEMSIIRIRKRYCQNKVASIRYPKEIKKTVIQLNANHSYKRISDITGIRYETVLKWCKENKTIMEKALKN